MTKKYQVRIDNIIYRILTWLVISDEVLVDLTYADEYNSYF